MQTEKRAALRTKEIESKTNVVASVEFVVRAALHDSVEDDFVHSIAGRIIAEPENRGEPDAGQISASLVQFGEALEPRHQCGKARRWHLWRHLRILGTSFRRGNWLSERRNRK